MYHVSTQGVDERMINVHYYYYYSMRTNDWLVQNKTSKQVLALVHLLMMRHIS